MRFAKDVAALITRAFTIFESNGMNKQALDEAFAVVHLVTSRIVLRLNPREPETDGIVAAMNTLREAIHTTDATFAEMNNAVSGLTVATQVVLKKEWRRVKRGEPFYRVAFWTVITIVSAILILLVIKETLMHVFGFNHSLWNALWVLGPVAVLAAGILTVFSVRKNRFFFHFDPKNNANQLLKDEEGEFAPHSGRYQDLAKLVITLSVGAIAFLINSMTTQKPPFTDFATKLSDVTPIVIGFFGAAIAALIVFMILQTVWYEEYCHSADHNTYRAWKYALCNVLGWSGMLAFLLGFAWLAANVFS
jgi:hypothetical protein